MAETDQKGASRDAIIPLGKKGSNLELRIIHNAENPLWQYDRNAPDFESSQLWKDFLQVVVVHLLGY